MPDRTWKRVEREFCRELGGERRGPTGRDLPDCDDCVKVGLEIKSYKKLVFLTKDWEQAVRNAEKLGLIPVLAVREGGRNGRREVKMYKNDYFVLRDLAGLPILRPEWDGRWVRMLWSNFAAIYRAAYTPTEGDSTV